MNKLTLKELSRELSQSKYTLILCHKNPDPDTLGSAFSLKCILEHFGSNVKIACCDNAPRRFSFISKGEELSYKEDGYERIIAVDVASPMQLGDLEHLSEKVDFTIDHHGMNTRFSDYYEDFCAACCEIIFEIANELNIFDKLPMHFYESVYAGISGDTGCFKYSNTTKRTMECGAKLVEKGIDFAEINRLIFDSKSVSEIKAQKLTYENMELLCDGKLAIAIFTNKMKSENNITDEDIADIVNYVRCIEGVLVAVSIKETKKDGVYSISSRANAEIDVSLVCAKIGGGGHKRAAGAKLEAGSIEEAKEKVAELFSASL